LPGGIIPHSFKSDEWVATEDQLLSLMRQYQSEYIECDFSYWPNGWSSEAIIHFLHLYHWLYGEPEPQQHHFNYVLTIIRDGKL
jgi:hypothetical protein